MILLERAGTSDSAATRAAWQEFVGTGTVGPARSGAVRPHVLRAWQRSANAGCSPHSLTAERLGPTETLALLERERKLIEAARPYIAALSRSAGNARHAAQLADRGARVLDVVGDERSVTGPEAVPGPGAVMSEAGAGANGLGTTLAEGGYTEIIGPEHFIEGFHGYTCQGIPIAGAGGAILGVMSISLLGIGTMDRIRDILFCASQGIECDLLSQELLDTVVRSRHDSATGVAERLRQDIVQHLAAARLKLELAAQRLARGGDTAALLETAEELTVRFRRRATLWRDLVTEAVAAPSPFRLDEMVEQMIALLSTEASVTELHLAWGMRQDAAVVLADPHGAARQLLAEILTGMQRIGRGGRLWLEVMTEPERRLGAVLVHGHTAAEEAVPSARIDFPLLP
jgi:transcriptional regulator of acetoin/glycerol metabolism